MNIQLMTLRNLKDFVAELIRLDASEALYQRFCARGLHRCVRVWGAGGVAARELHDALLAAGGSAVLPANPSAAACDVLLSGTYEQFQAMAGLLPSDDPHLRACAARIHEITLHTEHDPAPTACNGYTLLWGRRTYVMGILNTTPDSFYAQSRTPDFSSAVDAARAMLQAGADIIDVGGESTRPGADPVSADEELRRTAPVIKAIRAEFPDALISIDTYKAKIAAAAFEAGANMLNDISALSLDPDLARVAADAACPVCLMHMQGSPRNMQTDPVYEKDVVGEIMAFLEEMIESAISNGIAGDKIIVDPGIGFGKTAEHNLEILSRLDELRTLGRPVLVGASRKRFIGATLDLPDEAGRLEGSLAVAALAVSRFADIVRVHDVPQTVQVVRMADAVVRKKRTVSLKDVKREDVR